MLIINSSICVYKGISKFNWAAKTQSEYGQPFLHKLGSQTKEKGEIMPVLMFFASWMCLECSQSVSHLDGLYSQTMNSQHFLP